MFAQIAFFSRLSSCLPVLLLLLILGGCGGGAGLSNQATFRIETSGVSVILRGPLVQTANFGWAIQVPEGGQNGLTIKLGSQPASNTSITFIWAGANSFICYPSPFLPSGLTPTNRPGWTWNNNPQCSSGKEVLIPPSTDLNSMPSPPSFLRFTPENWNMPQRITITAAQDADAMVGARTLTFLASAKAFAITAFTIDDEASAGASAATADEDDSQAAEQKLTTEVLAEISRKTMAGAVDMLGLRFDAPPESGTALAVAGQQLQAPPRSVLPLDFHGNTKLQDDALHEEVSPMEIENALRNSAFTLAGRTDGDSAITVWGRGDLRRFRGQGAAGRWRGSANSGWLGADMRLTGGALAGLALARSKGDADYWVGSGMGRLETSLTTFWPYLQLRTASGGAVRLLLGTGQGDATLRPTRGQSERADLDFLGGSIGGSQPFAQQGGFTFLATGDVSATRMRVDAAAGAVLSDTTVDTYRVRGGVEARHEDKPLSGSHWVLSPRGSLLLRQDGGDGVTGTGLEIRGVGHLSASDSRFSISMDGHWLAVHSASNRREWGASLEARLSPDSDGRGLSLSVAPQVGALRNRASLDSSIFGVAPARNSNRSRLAAQAGYGFRVGSGMLTPFVETVLAEGRDGTRHYAGGIRFERSDGLLMRLMGQHQRSGDSASATHIGLDLKFPF